MMKGKARFRMVLVTKYGAAARRTGSLKCLEGQHRRYRCRSGGYDLSFRLFQVS